MAPKTLRDLLSVGVVTILAVGVSLIRDSFSASDADFYMMTLSGAWIIAFGLVLGCVHIWYQVRNRPGGLGLGPFMARWRHFAWLAFGRTTRVAFFGAVILIGWMWVDGWDRSAIDKPLAALTLGDLFGLVVRAGIAVVAITLWFRWAFTAEKKDYPSWAAFGAFAVFGVVFFWNR